MLREHDTSWPARMVTPLGYGKGHRAAGGAGDTMTSLLALSVLLGLAFDALAASTGDVCSMWNNTAATQVDHDSFDASHCEGNGWQHQSNPKRCRCTLNCTSHFGVQNTTIVFDEPLDDESCELFELELVSSGSFTLDPRSSIRASLVNINVTNNASGFLEIYGVINASGLGWIPSSTPNSSGQGLDPFDQVCKEKADGSGPKYLMGGSFGGTGGGFLAPASDGGGGMACSQGDKVRVHTYCNQTRALLSTGVCEDGQPPFGSGAGGACPRSSGDQCNSSQSRGGGSIHIQALSQSVTVTIGKQDQGGKTSALIVADGQPVAPGCMETTIHNGGNCWCGGGSGGSVLIEAHDIVITKQSLEDNTNTIISANGGDTTSSLSGSPPQCSGPGAGGGGRILFNCNTLQPSEHDRKTGYKVNCGTPDSTAFFKILGYALVQARGGVVSDPLPGCEQSTPQCCQAGGAGTVISSKIGDGAESMTQLIVSGGLIEKEWNCQADATSAQEQLWASTPLNQSILDTDAASVFIGAIDVSNEPGYFSPTLVVTAENLMVTNLTLGKGSALFAPRGGHRSIYVEATERITINGQVGCCRASANGVVTNDITLRAKANLSLASHSGGGPQDSETVLVAQSELNLQVNAPDGGIFGGSGLTLLAPNVSIVSAGGACFAGDSDAAVMIGSQLTGQSITANVTVVASGLNKNQDFNEPTCNGQGITFATLKAAGDSQGYNPMNLRAFSTYNASLHLLDPHNMFQQVLVSTQEVANVSNVERHDRHEPPRATPWSPPPSFWSNGTGPEFCNVNEKVWPPLSSAALANYRPALSSNSWIGMWIMAKKQVLVPEGTGLVSSFVHLCAPAISVEAAVNASGGGFAGAAQADPPANLVGPGAGQCTVLDKGSIEPYYCSGGGHGGDGGQSGGVYYDKNYIAQSGRNYANATSCNVMKQRTVDNCLFGSAGGSGGGSTDSPQGGAGGGVIIVSAERLNLKRPLVANGLKATNAGGGGAGGSILIRDVKQILNSNDPTSDGPPVQLSACGGHGGFLPSRGNQIQNGAGVGGGGGGGVFGVIFANGSGPTTGAFTISVDPGDAGNCMDGTNYCHFVGYDSARQGRPGYKPQPHCGVNRGGLLCACEAGNFLSLSPDLQCQSCPKGQYQGQNISAQACSACNFGRYSDDMGSPECKTCTGPEKENLTWQWLKGPLDGNQCQDADDTCTASCAFSCFSGYTRIDGGCKDLVQAIVGMFGGPVAFCGVVTLVLAGLFLTWNKLCQKPAEEYFRRRREAKRRSMYSESSSEVTDNATALLYEDIGAPSSSHSLQLRDGDLPRHVCRLYFCGDNTIDWPWHLPRKLSDSLGHIVYADKFDRFARHCNGHAATYSGTWYSRLYTATRVLCWPAAPWLQHYVRCRRLHKVQQFISGYNHECMKSSRSRALEDSFKFGCDPHMTLAYIDILEASRSDGVDDWRSTEISTPANAMSTAVAPAMSSSMPAFSGSNRVRGESWDPQTGHDLLPISLTCSGDGTFESPCLLDCNDVLVRAVPSRLGLLIDLEWVRIVAELNTRLRVIDPQNFRNTVKPVLDYIMDLNAKDDLGDLMVHLVHNKLHSADELFDTCQLPISLPRNGKLGILITQREGDSPAFALDSEAPTLHRTVWVRCDKGQWQKDCLDSPSPPVFTGKPNKSLGRVGNMPSQAMRKYSLPPPAHIESLPALSTRSARKLTMREEELGIREEAPAAETSSLREQMLGKNPPPRSPAFAQTAKRPTNQKRLSILVPRDRAQSNFDESALEGFKASPVMGRTPPVSKSFSGTLFDLGRSRSGINLESVSTSKNISNSNVDSISITKQFKQFNATSPEIAPSVAPAQQDKHTHYFSHLVSYSGTCQQPTDFCSFGSVHVLPRNTLRGHFWCGGRWQPLPNPLKVMESTPIALQTLLLVCSMVDLMCMLLVMVRFWCIPKQSPGDICLQAPRYVPMLVFPFAWFVSPVLGALFATSSSRFARVYLRWLLVSFLNLLVMLIVGHAFADYPKLGPGQSVGNVTAVAQASNDTDSNGAGAVAYLTGDYIMYVCASFVSKLLQIFLGVRYVTLIETRAETPGWSALHAYIEHWSEHPLAYAAGERCLCFTSAEDEGNDEHFATGFGSTEEYTRTVSHDDSRRFRFMHCSCCRRHRPVQQQQSLKSPRPSKLRKW